MSREEAAAVYLDTILGFRRRYEDFVKTASILSDVDRNLLDQAVSTLPQAELRLSTSGFFGAVIENDFQIHKGRK